MIGIERARFLEIGSRRGDVATRDVLFALAQELLDERGRFEALACLVTQYPRLIVHQIIRQHLGRNIHDHLVIARGHGGACLRERVGGVGGKERVDVDRQSGITRFVDELLRRIEHRIHAQDQSAARDDLVHAALFVERQRLLEGRNDTIFHCRRQ